MKRIAVFFLALMLMSMSVLSVSAAVVDPGETAEPNWTNVRRFEFDLNYYEDTGYATATAVGFTGVTTGMAGTLEIYRYLNSEWVLVAQKSALGTTSLMIELEFRAYYYNRYKAVMTVDSYGIGGSEIASDYCIKMYR